MNFRISVAMATYQGEKYIEEQIQSIQRQTVLPNELIIVDDCSSDLTVAKINKIIKTLNFEVRLVVNNKNIGYVRSFSKALEMCVGDIIFMADQDDVWLPRKLELMRSKFIDRPDIQLLIHDVEYCKENLTPIGQTKIQRMTGIYDLNREYVVGMATAVRGYFLKLCLPIPDEKIITHDSWLHLCASLINKKLILNDVLALYRRHASNATIDGNLNVDFITNASHFERRSVVVSQLTERVAIERNDLVTVLEWIKSKKNELLISGLISAVAFENTCTNLENQCDNIYRRECIWAMPRYRRLFPAIKLYISSGYNDFTGLRSLFKDLIIK